MKRGNSDSIRPTPHTTILVAFHHRKHSNAPAIATEHRQTIRYCISASGAVITLLFNGKYWHSTTRIIAISCLCNSNQYFLLLISILLPFPTQQRNDHRRIIEARRTNTDCLLHSFSPQVSPSAGWHAKLHFHCATISYPYFYCGCSTAYSGTAASHVVFRFGHR